MNDAEQKTLDDILSGLDSCLERESAALLTGDLGAISALMEEKSALIEDLNALGSSEQGTLDTLKKKAERNQVLLTGALEGIRRVSDRLADMDSLRHSFDTYDSHGKRRTIAVETVRHVEKRA
ncbi:MAG: hypothetical protein AAFO72_00840 [Pseudomonadota bacterium]